MMQGRTVREAQATNTAREFAELCALWAIEPWGPTRDAWHAAAICKTIAEALTRPPPGGYKLDQFLVEFGPPRAQSPADMRRILAQAADLAGVKVHGYDR